MLFGFVIQYNKIMVSLILFRFGILIMVLLILFRFGILTMHPARCDA